MTIVSILRSATLAAALLASTAVIASAKDVTISVWSGGSGPNDNYRVDAIEIAADLLEREAAIRGEELNITVQKTPYSGWEEFKQALTLAAEAKKAPNIVATGHEDIGPWAQAGLIVPVENYIDLDGWPISDIYPNLMSVASFNGTVYGIPQDAESRPFFFWRPHMKAIGYTDADLDALPAKVEKGEYTLKNVLEDAKKMQDKGLVQPGYGFYPRTNNGPDYWQFYTSFGGLMEDDGELVFDKAAMKRAYQYFADLVAAGVTKKNHIGTPGDQWWKEVATGKAGIWHGGTWHYARLVNQEGLKDFFDNVQFTLIPAGEGGKANTLTHPLTYLLMAGHDEATTQIAADLVKIASEPRINALHAIKSAHLGISQAETKVDLYASDRWASEATERLLPHANAMPNNAEFGKYWTIMWKNLEASWTGAKTVDAAVSDAETELKATLGDAIVIR
ncbi:MULTISPECIES: extracellular solute-binding protein [unclassified Ensifer]|uniref:extracellular solute-binding protein n=1 Tax=unclassified Ensifer TaxID=2633371 RepID=UPI000813CB42|nr:MULTISPECIES: extracellular solute-binding protein [unclassified Ensifer]OCP19202.1 ABC transporter substrate-binding protein [Ensifer sp. LC54]OCP27360.1 ABC transporter substrate-binding protein [Ensifer sp. LC384]